MERATSEDVTSDALLGGRVTIIQPRRGYRVAVDPVLLAAAVAADQGDTVLDAGAGTGAVALCLAARVGGCKVVGLERDPQVADLARRAVELNAMADRVEIIAGDLAEPPAALRGRSFDHVVTNPPYVEAARAGARGGARDAAHVEGLTLAAWLAACLRRLHPRGMLTLIHRADRLTEILATLDGPCGALSVMPIWTKPEAAPASRVIIAARKGTRGGTRLLRGLTLHQEGGGYTSEAEAVLRDAAPLSL